MFQAEDMAIEMEPHVDGVGHGDGASDAGEGAEGVPGGIGEYGGRCAVGLGRRCVVASKRAQAQGERE